MKLSEAIKPVSYFKNHMAEAIRHLNENRGTMIITQNGEAKAAIIDIKEFEQMQETMAMLKLIAQGKTVWLQSVSDRPKISCAILKVASIRVQADAVRGFYAARSRV